MKKLYTNSLVGIGIIICCLSSYGMFVALGKNNFISYYLSLINPFFGVGYSIYNIL